VEPDGGTSPFQLQIGGAAQSDDRGVNLNPRATDVVSNLRL
jgi:hypothetical protein